MSDVQLSIEQWSGLTAAEQAARLARPKQSRSEGLKNTVAEILQQVRQQGDEAVLQLTQRFDYPEAKSLTLNTEEKQQALQLLDSETKAAIDTAYGTIKRFHQAQQPSSTQVETAPGVICESRYAAINSVGLYIPGGTATLPSTALMLGIPAQLAGCPRKVLATPPARDGSIPPAIVYVAELCQIDEIILCGGAQAVAALAYGTDSIRAVDKIFGPGNAFVTEAKQQVSQDSSGVAIDMPAGPSELLVIADDSANAAFVAADLLSQAEHGADSQVLLLTPSAELAKEVEQQLIKQTALLSRADIIKQALANSRLLVTDSLADAIAISERYAPEHLSLQFDRARDYLPRLTTAGSIFLGHYTPESGGDYATGTNHVLPTYGYARNYSSLGLTDFYRRYTIQEATQQGLSGLAAAISRLAEIEGLDAHKRAVTVRLEGLE
ncbi:histidinol dehydrogenase [Idiomarina seosinensis]|uniref:histidinol dehydrogenase n=1 Tax=Idiomarina seosinensis TaxID=281739 RepID=UPI00384C39F6